VIAAIAHLVTRIRVLRKKNVSAVTWANDCNGCLQSIHYVLTSHSQRAHPFETGHEATILERDKSYYCGHCPSTNNNDDDSAAIYRIHLFSVPSLATKLDSPNTWKETCSNNTLEIFRASAQAKMIV